MGVSKSVLVYIVLYGRKLFRLMIEWLCFRVEPWMDDDQKVEFWGCIACDFKGFLVFVYSVKCKWVWE